MRHAWPSKQCCWLGSSRYSCCRRVAVTNSNCVTNIYTDGNGYGYGECYRNGNGYGYAKYYTNSHSHSYGQTNTDCTAERNTETAPHASASPQSVIAYRHLLTR